MKKATKALLALCLVAPVLLLVAPLALASETESTARAETSPTGPPPIVNADYQLMEEDVLRLDVWGEPQLSNQQMQVTPDGKVNVAFVGEMQAAGLTQAELIASIGRKLEEAGILISPKVQITLINMHRPSMRVLGQVQRPGEVLFKEGDTIMDAIAQAGSYASDAWLEKATLTHKGSDKPIPIDLRKLLAGDMSQNYQLQKGDTLYIPPEDYQNKIYVLGMVNRPGIYSLKEKTTILDAITLASGPTERGALKSTVVVRGDPTKPQKVQANLTKLFDKGDLSQNIILQPGDVVIVPETKKPDWNKIGQVLSTVLNLGYLRRYGLF